VSFRSLSALVSEAPLTSELVEGDGKSLALLRRLDPAFAEDREVQAAFRRERDAALRLPHGHPHLVPALQSGDLPEAHLVREYSPHGTLLERLRAQPALGGAQLLTALGATLSALDELDRLGLWHGDPSPANLLLNGRGDARLADPVSARRHFAEGTASLEEMRERDRARLCRWLSAAAATVLQSRPRDEQARELLGALRSGGTGARVDALRRLAAQPQARAPLDRGGPPRAVRPVPPEPIRVLVQVGRIADPRAAYRVARLLGPELKRDMAELRRALGAAGLTVALSYPEPAASLAAKASGEGAKVSVLRAE